MSQKNKTALLKSQAKTQTKIQKNKSTLNFQRIFRLYTHKNLSFWRHLKPNNFRKTIVSLFAVMLVSFNNHRKCFQDLKLKRLMEKIAFRCLNVVIYPDLHLRTKRQFLTKNFENFNDFPKKKPAVSCCKKAKRFCSKVKQRRKQKSRKTKAHLTSKGFFVYILIKT